MHQITAYIIMPTLDRCAVLLHSLEALHHQSHPAVEIIVVDSGSIDGSVEEVRRSYPHVHVVTCGHDKWWAGATNAGVRKALALGGSGDVALTLNDDTICPPDYVANLVKAHLADTDSIMGSVAIEAGTSTVLDAGVTVDWWTARFTRLCRGRPLEECASLLSRTMPVDLVSGRGTLVPLQAYRELGLYAEETLPHYGADYEFAARARRRGWGVKVCGQARLESYPHLTGIDVTVEPVDLSAMARSLISRRSSNCLWYRWAFGLLAAPRPHVATFIPLDTLRAVAGMVRRQTGFRLRRRSGSGVAP